MASTAGYTRAALHQDCRQATPENGKDEPWQDPSRTKNFPDRRFLRKKHPVVDQGNFLRYRYNDAAGKSGGQCRLSRVIGVQNKRMLKPPRTARKPNAHLNGPGFLWGDCDRQILGRDAGTIARSPNNADRLIQMIGKFDLKRAKFARLAASDVINCGRDCYRFPSEVGYNVRWTFGQEKENAADDKHD